MSRAGLTVGEDAIAALAEFQGNVGDPDDVAAAILWLLFDEASFVQRVVLTVSGRR